MKDRGESIEGQMGGDFWRPVMERFSERYRRRSDDYVCVAASHRLPVFLAGDV